MCGRFTLGEHEVDELSMELGVPGSAFEGLQARFNIAPTDEHLIVRMKQETREVLRARWGLVNSWAKDAKGAARAINARAEGIASRPMFKDAFERRRCIVPADGFYEWRREGKARYPSWIHRTDGRLLLFAGLYESWQIEPGTWQRTFTIITTAANREVAELHDRMPAVLDDRDADLWMFRATERAELQELLRPAPDGTLTLRPVSTRANSVANDDPTLIEPAAATGRLL